MVNQLKADNKNPILIQSDMGKNIKVTGMFLSVEDANKFCEMYPDHGVISCHKQIIFTALLSDLGDETEEQNITKEEKAEYIKSGFAGCPKCKDTEHLETSPLQSDNNQVWQNITCENCGFEFTDIYTLTDVEEQK